ncbi:MAG: hypothetical protein ACFFAY_08355 [Promethearchaeota archaeon]
MRRKGAILGIAILLMVSIYPSSVSAYSYWTTWSWDCGIKVNVHVESIDIWATDIPYDIFARLTLLELGNVAEVLSLTFVLKLVTESVDTGIYVVSSPWNQPGEVIEVMGRFVVSPIQINHAFETGYVAGYYYQLNMTVRLTGDSILNLWMGYKGPYPASFSTAQFIVLWPWLPIGIVFFLYWGAFYGLRRFNRRYDTVKQITEEERESRS